MSMRYQGSVVSATPPTITPATGLNPGGTAPGIWTLEQQFQAKGANLWPRTNGESVYTTAGTYTFVAPANITSVSVVCVGATQPWISNTGTGRGGGGLGYKNNISVVPGNSYTVVVANGGAPTDSYFIDALTVMGGTASGTNTGGTFVGDGGGNGGNGGTGTLAGGGGAGGYAGNGGNGGNTSSNGTAGSGGAGGGGAAGQTNNFGGGGGGVGLYGIGANGAGGIFSSTPTDYAAGGGGGSGGQNGTPSNTGGAFNPAQFGGGIAGTNAEVSGGAQYGAVRIVYPGDVYTFPSNAPITS